MAFWARWSRIWVRNTSRHHLVPRVISATSPSGRFHWFNSGTLKTYDRVVFWARWSRIWVRNTYRQHLVPRVISPTTSWGRFHWFNSRTLKTYDRWVFGLADHEYEFETNLGATSCPGKLHKRYPGDVLTNLLWKPSKLLIGGFLATLIANMSSKHI